MKILAPRTIRSAAVWIVTLLAGGAIACGPRTAAPPAPGAASGAPVPVTATAPPFARLVGSWTRTDGGYVLDVRAVDPQGKADAAYLNPRPIHVEQALATRAGGTLTLFVELQDANYPGSTYNLAFDPAGDLLEGTYFQAVEGQTYSVIFERR